MVSDDRLVESAADIQRTSSCRTVPPTEHPAAQAKLLAGAPRAGREEGTHHLGGGHGEHEERCGCDGLHGENGRAGFSRKLA